MQDDTTPQSKAEEVLLGDLNPPLSYRLLSLLNRQGKNYVSDITGDCPCILLDLRNVGQIGVNEIKRIVRENGYEFAPCHPEETLIKSYKFQYPTITICRHIDETRDAKL